MPPEHLTRSEVRSIDRIAMERYGMTGLVLMENAGRGCADKLCELGIRGHVVVACGCGNNGGDGFVIARHLEARGYAVRVLLAGRPEKLQGDAKANFEILRKAELAIVELVDSVDVLDGARLDAELAGADWIVDALLGTGAAGEPREPLAEIIRRFNAASGRKLAVDLPSGLDCETGIPATATFRADHTCTFVAPKVGFANAAAQPFLGQIHIHDIGVPRKLLAEFGLR